MPHRIFELQNHKEMKVKETIAFIGETDEICSDLIQKLAAENYPLVLVAKEGNHFEKLSGQILNHKPDADIETIHCEREGCWEADVIVLTHAANPDPKLLEKIKEVVNQKILVYILNEKDRGPLTEEEITISKQILTNTEVVQVIADPVSKEMDISGTDEATTSIENIFKH